MLRLFAWAPTILWAILISALSSIPSLKATDNYLIQNLINITAHFTEYFILTLLLYRSLKFEKLSSSLETSAYISTIYSLLDEFHQYFVPGRMADIKDIMIDVIGILVAVWYLSKRKVK